MATISSTMRLIDGFTAPIQKSIDAMNRMVDMMESVNRSAQLPDMSQEFGEIRADINLAAHALDNFNEGLGKTDQQTQSLSRVRSGFGGISQAIIVVNQSLQLMQTLWGSVQKIGTVADNRTGVDARLSLINDGLHTQVQLEQQVMDAANRSRGEYEATASLVAKMGRQDYFKGNNAAAIAFAETMNKGMVVSGASTIEANNALTQLSQGLASGVLRGEEFNSIMENSPVIAEMMAESLGVTKGELREMAQEGELTTDVVVSSIMAQADAIDEQFSQMPVTFGQACSESQNYISQMLDGLSQEGQAVDLVVNKIQELNLWLATVEGQQFTQSMVAGMTELATGIIWVVDLFAGGYQSITSNWSTIEPIFWGLTTAIGGLAAAYMIYNGVQTVTAAVTGIRGAVEMFATGQTLAATAAQYGLNTALLACPMTKIIVLAAALIGVIIGLTIWIMDLWQTNIDFKVGVISAWNDVLKFFGQVPIFFIAVGYGIADIFADCSVSVLLTLESMVNGSIYLINQLINLLNTIPGVAIESIDAVTFGAAAAAEEEANKASRSAKLAGKRANAAAEAASRERELTANEAAWRSEIANQTQQEAARQYAPEAPHGEQAQGYEFPPVELAGGKIDKVGKIEKEVDISNQSLEYLRDIAEIQALNEFNAYTSVDYNNTNDLKLSDEDANLLKDSANSGMNVYYLAYTGGVRIKNDISQGQDWESIKQEIFDQSEDEIETGLSFVEEAVYG